MKRNLISIIAFLFLLNLFSQDNRIPVLKSDGTKTNIFMSGGNLAWDQFANDFGPGATNFEYFEEVFTAFESAGGNAMRLWVHINGANNPNLDGNGYCTGLEESQIPDMKRVLDLAYNHNIVLILSLWSFDMLNNRDYPLEVSAQGKLILTVEENIQAYIDNALIPMVEAFKDHPSVGAWEIFNEPEGMSNEFGWSHTNHVPMSIIQRFVNRLTGAIHRADSDALVTNGTWAMYANSDVPTGSDTYKNYYSDEELIAKGGDANGTLDFYQVHYYDWMSNDISVMHHPASYWGLDKAIVVGEFFPLDAAGIAWQTYFNYLYKNGYAGALPWQWAGENNSTEPYRTNMVALMKSIRDYDDILIEAGRNRFPTIGTIDNGLFDLNAGTVTNYVDLDDISNDPDGDSLTFSVESNTNSTLVALSINSSNGLDLTFTPEMTGSATIMLKVTDAGGLTATSEFGIVVRESGTGNLALYRTTVYTSSNESGSNGDPLAATDGDYNTRWSSQYIDASWYYVDLGSVYEINNVIFYWETAFGQRYEIQVSTDASVWTTVYTENAGNGGTDNISFNAVEAQYVRMNGLQRGTEWGYSFYEFEVYGSGKAPDSIPLEGISLTPSALTLNPMQTSQINVQYTPSNATNLSIAWATDNASVATVSTTGIVTAHSLGNATITATSEDGGFTAICTVNVTDEPTITCESYTPIALPFTHDGAGNFCWVTAGTIEYINSWNLDYLTINGLDITNSWTNSFPAKIDGNYYISCGASVGWAHIEIDGTSDPVGETFALTVNQPTGGTISPTSGDYASGTIVSLSAVASAGYEFSSWSGDASGTSSTTTVTMNSNKTVSASFTQITDPEMYTLTIVVDGEGTVTPETAVYTAGTKVILTAEPVVGYSFSSWSGAASGTSLTTTVTMDANKTVTAIFVANDPVYYNLTVFVDGNGSVSPYNESYLDGTVVNLIAVADSNNHFVGWSGDANSSDSEISITMSGDKNITASFAPDGGSGCDNPTTISIPYSQNGVGQYCFFTTNEINNVNSWNMEAVEINGVDYTNNWSDAMPAKQDGGYYIYYKGNYEWSHLETSGLKSAEDMEISRRSEDIEVYPNPFNSDITIDFNKFKNVRRIELYNSLGKLIRTLDADQFTGGQAQIKINSSGHYFLLRLYTDTNTFTKKLIRL